MHFTLFLVSYDILNAPASASPPAPTPHGCFAAVTVASPLYLMTPFKHPPLLNPGSAPAAFHKRHPSGKYFAVSINFVERLTPCQGITYAEAC